MLIETRKLFKQYPRVPRPALAGVDLQIDAGGVVVLLGPNGAGKTTLVEILEGLRAPSSGSARVLGLDPTREAWTLKQRIGVQLQATALPPDLSVREVLRLSAAFYPRTRPLVEVLRQLDLEHLQRALTRTLSGGERQRLALALALVHDPELVLLDEPTTGLDPVARRALHQIIAGLKREGRSVLLTTHYLEEAEKLADRVIVLRDGVTVADGAPLELARRASGASTVWIAFQDDGTQIDTTSLSAAGLRPQGREGPYLRFLTDDPSAAIAALAELLRAPGAALADIRLRRPTLEDFYLELVSAPTSTDSVRSAS